MGYLIPVTPQAFVNRISIFGPDETNIKEISYQLSLHLTIPINIFTPPKSLELYIVADIIWGRDGGQVHRYVGKGHGEGVEVRYITYVGEGCT